MSFTSSTQSVPAAGAIPRHIAVILDGNGRWATRRHLPRAAGHRKGVEAVRATVEGCARRGVEFLTLFAFSSENWRRPAEEVSLLMRLFLSALQREVTQLHRNGIRLRIVGDLSRFEPRLQKMIADAEARTAGNTRMTLTICANYGGRVGQSCRPPTRCCASVRRRACRSTSPWPKTTCRVICRWPMHPNPTCSSVPGASSASRQLPALAARLYRAVLLRVLLARVQRPASRRGHPVVWPARTPLWPHQCADTRGS